MAFDLRQPCFAYNTGPCYDHSLTCSVGHNKIPNQISVFLQIQISLAGEVREGFRCRTGTEYAYDRGPKSMNTLAQAVWLAMAGIGSCLALTFSPLVVDPRLVVIHCILTALFGGSIMLLWLIFEHLDKEATTML